MGPHGDGASVDLRPVGLDLRIAADVVEALALAAAAARALGQEEVAAVDLVAAIAEVSGATPSPPHARPVAPARVTPYRDGPYLLRGAFELTDQDGEPIACTRQTVALCRCGRSQIRPFCDGTHKLTGFRAASGVEDRASRGNGSG